MKPDPDLALIAAQDAGLLQLIALHRRVVNAEAKVEALRAQRLALYRDLSALGISAATMAAAIGQDRSAITAAIRRAAARSAE